MTDMEAAALSLRLATFLTIAENPVGITILRRRYLPQPDGGRGEQISSPPTFTGRIVPRLTFTYQQNDAGIYPTKKGMLLAPHDADIQFGHDVEDDFMVGGVRYRIKSVTPRKYQGHIYSQQCEVEEVR